MWWLSDAKESTAGQRCGAGPARRQMQGGHSPFTGGGGEWRGRAEGGDSPFSEEWAGRRRAKRAGRGNSQGHAHFVFEEQEFVDWAAFEERIFGQANHQEFADFGGFADFGAPAGLVASKSCPECKVLGIAAGAVISKEVLKESLRVQVLKWHPDRHQSEEDKHTADLKFKRAYVAHDTLLAKCL